MLARLPDPYWLASALAFLPVVPAVGAIEELSGQTAVARGAVWQTRHTILILIASAIFALALVGVFAVAEG